MPSNPSASILRSSSVEISGTGDIEQDGSVCETGSLMVAFSPQSGQLASFLILISRNEVSSAR